MGRGSNHGFGLNSSVLHHISYINTSNCRISEDTSLKLSMNVCFPVITAKVCINSVPKKKSEI